MKQRILNSRLGHFALAYRDKFDLLRAAIWNAEVVGMIANDQIASMLIAKICKPNMVFVDVGAHIGSVISEVHAHEKSIHIIAIEAIPEKASNLIRKFPFAEIHQCAVGESDDEALFHIDLVRSGYSSLSRPSGNSSSFKEITVPLKKIDSLVPPVNVDAIKIDVEGAELGVLRGGENLLLACRPTIMFESGPKYDTGQGYTNEALWQYLSEMGYLVVLPNRLAHNDQGLSMQGFIESHIYPRRTTNYFAVAKERRVEIRDSARRVIGIMAEK